MSTRTRRLLQVVVVVLGVFFFVGNLVRGGVGMWDFLPLIGMACGLSAIETVRRNQEAGL